ncbi:hypothetical protein PFLA_b0575 [Pseudoalteromonas flavipulchra NCIMB 2033 = ATCC BAA-314]|nr:hypothetical protein [Pseudoalteromonas flavipulchra NCIMB 2033 = ATCC BAA-314]
MFNKIDCFQLQIFVFFNLANAAKLRLVNFYGDREYLDESKL